MERASKQRILSGGFEPSRNEYDWLGDGAYFFQDAPRLEGKMNEDSTGTPIDPEVARAAIEKYYATTPPRQVIEDARRFSPELADRLGLTNPRPALLRPGIFGWLAAFGRSVHRLFSWPQPFLLRMPAPLAGCGQIAR